MRLLLDAGEAGTFTYFQPDRKKIGGTYVTVEGIVKKIDPLEQCICLTNGRKIPINDILNVEI